MKETNGISQVFFSQFWKLVTLWEQICFECILLEIKGGEISAIVYVANLFLEIFQIYVTNVVLCLSCCKLVIYILLKTHLLLAIINGWLSILRVNHAKEDTF